MLNPRMPGKPGFSQVRSYAGELAGISVYSGNPSIDARRLCAEAKLEGTTACVEPNATIASTEELEAALSAPSPALVEAAAQWRDGIVVLGASGKMGPTLCRMAARALTAAGSPARVTAVSRFSNREEENRLREAGVETFRGDLTDPGFVSSLPDCGHVVFMAGRKFGSTGDEAATWAINAYAPALAASKYRHARVVVFSSGNVYPATPIAHGGCTEADEPGPVGEYAQSVLGRERLFEHFSRRDGLQVVQFRLNYACELRYGVLVDIAEAIAAARPVDVTTGAFNVIWQRDANEYALRALAVAASPPVVLNATGPETVSTRWAARRLAASMDQPVNFTGEERPEALLSNAGRAHDLFGYPRMPLERMVRLVADWVARCGPSIGKPTHFQARDGRF